MINHCYMRSSNNWPLDRHGFLSNICHKWRPHILRYTCLHTTLPRSGVQNKTKKGTNTQIGIFSQDIWTFPRLFSLKTILIEVFLFLFWIWLSYLSVYFLIFFIYFYLFSWFSSYLCILHSLDCNMQMRLKVMSR